MEFSGVFISIDKRSARPTELLIGTLLKSHNSITLWPIFVIDLQYEQEKLFWPQNVNRGFVISHQDEFTSI